MRREMLGLLATSCLLLSVGNVADAAPELHAHRLGTAANVTLWGHTSGQGDYFGKYDYGASPGVAISYQYRFSPRLSVGARVEGWILLSELRVWRDSKERYLLTLECVALQRNSWEIPLTLGGGFSTLWDHHASEQYFGLGPSLSAAVGVRRWFGNVAVLANVGGDIDLHRGTGPLDDSDGAGSGTALLFVGLGIELAL